MKPIIASACLAGSIALAAGFSAPAAADDGDRYRHEEGRKHKQKKRDRR